MTYRTPTHFEALIQALAQTPRLTYTDLARLYGNGYNAQGWAQAVRRAKGLGLIRREGRAIVACGACPCCGRGLGKDNEE